MPISIQIRTPISIDTDIDTNIDQTSIDIYINIDTQDMGEVRRGKKPACLVSGKKLVWDFVDVTLTLNDSSDI